MSARRFVDEEIDPDYRYGQGFDSPPGCRHKPPVYRTRYHINIAPRMVIRRQPDTDRPARRGNRGPRHPQCRQIPSGFGIHWDDVTRIGFAFKPVTHLNQLPDTFLSIPNHLGGSATDGRHKLEIHKDQAVIHTPHTLLQNNLFLEAPGEADGSFQFCRGPDCDRYPPPTPLGTRLDDKTPVPCQEPIRRRLVGEKHLIRNREPPRLQETVREPFVLSHVKRHGTDMIRKRVETTDSAPLVVQDKNGGHGINDLNLNASGSCFPGNGRCIDGIHAGPWYENYPNCHQKSKKMSPSHAELHQVYFRNNPEQLKLLTSSLTLGTIAGIVKNATTTATGAIQTLASTLTGRDRIGHWKARWGIGRFSCRVKPGLYALGCPTPDSPVLVTANYQLTVDTLRSALPRHNAWILVLDTAGINVWCAAGKGSFGTEELVHTINQTQLMNVVKHRQLILPQLGAPGVAAHRVQQSTGFRVVYGPVRATDIPAFLDAGFTASPAMRRVRFSLKDRLVLIPMELVFSGKYLLPLTLALAALSGFRSASYSVEHLQSYAPPITITLLVAWFTGAALGPALLPWLPGQGFAFKGLMAGILGLLIFPAACLPLHLEPLDVLVALTLIPAISSFLTLLFTGASTYASPSGVRKEMRIAIPMQVASASLGIGMWTLARFI